MNNITQWSSKTKTKIVLDRLKGRSIVDISNSILYEINFDCLSKDILPTLVMIDEHIKCTPQKDSLVSKDFHSTSLAGVFLC